ncbi:MAG: hypothetical protein NTZ79_17030 [Proteobacteria bacterium]|nr:hypothetical protein [Pseudomonadota bacterium]
MKTLTPRSLVWQASAAGVLAVLLSTAAYADAAPPPGRAALLGGALPGGAVISARSALLTPASGGPGTAVPIGADGAFRAEGLAAGHYKLRLISTVVAKQTQGATFGEKVQSGLAQAGGALASGAQLTSSAPPKGQSTPVRISMNVTVARQAARPVELDGEGSDVDVSADGVIAGIVIGVVAARQ